MGEHLLCKQGVAGSNPVISTRCRRFERAGWLACSLTTAYEILEKPERLRMSVVKLLRADGGCLGARKR